MLGGVDIDQGTWEDVIKECDENQDGKVFLIKNFYLWKIDIIYGICWFINIKS